MASLAASLRMPLKRSELTMVPTSVKAADMVAGSRISPSGWMTTLMGISYFRANSKSRWSWAGTAMTAPVPYSMRTKLAR